MTSELRTKNITYDDRDTNNLKYKLDWFHDGVWNASNAGQTGTLSGSNNPNARVTFNFPIPAIAFHYFGIIRSRGGLYGICVDCDPEEPNFQDVDALKTAENNETHLPIALFSKRFVTPAQHVVILTNKKDPRGVPEGNSQITIDRFVLEVVDDSPALAPVTSPPGPSPSPTSSLDKPKSNLDKSGAPVGGIVGGVIGGFLLAIIMIVMGVYHWHRRKRQLASNTDDGEANFLPIVPYPVMHPSISKEQRPKAGEWRRTLRRPPDPTPSGSMAIVTDDRFRRRELRREIDAERRPEPQQRHEADAGPIPAEDEESILPPLYEQVFRAGGPSNHPPSSQEPNDQSRPIA
ncbi:hypothetical protein AAF712_011660 [Marasmius tenuissimus]|uniref:Uncharacterized protein n=1 Tax=Marasmius tenuissimus TaxID=585030 RepID=A0ABR2ZIP2_9AGAR